MTALEAAIRDLTARLPRRRRDQYALLFVVLTACYFVTSSFYVQSIDTVSMYFPAWQLAHHGNVTMDAFAGRIHLFFGDVGGRVVSNRLPGAAWLATPLYLLDRGSWPHPWPGNLTAALATAGAMVALLALLSRLAPWRVAVGAVLLVSFATPTWTVSGDALWTHGPGQLWLLLGVLLYVRSRPFLGGLAFGLAVTTRPHYAVVPAIVGLADLVVRRRWRPFLGIAAGSGVGLAALMLYNHAVFLTWDPRGAYTPASGDTGGHSLDPTGLPASDLLHRIAGTLVSPMRGVLVLTPFLLLLLPGLVSGWRAAPLWVRSAAAGGTAYLLVQLRGNGFSGGYGFFSYRLAIEWLTLCAPLLLLAWTTWTARVRWRRRAFVGLALYSLATHAVGAVLFEIEHAEPDNWRTWGVWEVFAARPVASAVVAGMALVLGGIAVMALREPGVLPDLADQPRPGVTCNEGGRSAGNL